MVCRRFPSSLTHTRTHAHTRPTVVNVGGQLAHFLSGMYPKTNSRNCTCQQSSITRRDQRVRMTGSMQDMSANMHEFRLHVGGFALQLWLAEC